MAGRRSAGRMRSRLRKAPRLVLRREGSLDVDGCRGRGRRRRTKGLRASRSTRGASYCMHDSLLVSRDDCTEGKKKKSARGERADGSGTRLALARRGQRGGRGGGQESERERERGGSNAAENRLAIALNRRGTMIPAAAARATRLNSSRTKGGRAGAEDDRKPGPAEAAGGAAGGGRMKTEVEEEEAKQNGPDGGRGEGLEIRLLHRGRGWEKPKALVTFP